MQESPIADLLDATLESRADTLAERFRDAPFFPHVRIENFFSDDLCRRLYGQFPSFDPEARDELGWKAQKATREDVCALGEAYGAVDGLMRSPEFLALISRITGIPDLLYDPDYVGGGTHDNVDGAQLDTHVDFNYHPRRGWHRRLNVIVFLNPEWREEWGGCFGVHRDPWSADDEVRRFVPLWNHAVIFETSERSWHGFDKIRLPEERRDTSRKSFAVYLYTEDRPREEIASPHATVYVPQPLPPRFEAGYTLGPEDVLELRTLLDRRSQQIRFLYEREKEAEETVAGVKLELRSLESTAVGTLSLAGPIEQRGGVRGAWPDGWVGDAMDVRLRAEAPIKALTLEGEAPSPDGTPRRLVLSAGGRRVEAEVAGPFSLRLEIPLERGEEVVVDVVAGSTWQPAATGHGDDRRGLAFHFGRLGAEG
ncbi:MAG: 2OG-Fe(II) oxygenase [Acidobacteriota bacterium]